MKVSTVNQMRELDRTAIEEFGIVEDLLMENAGQAVYAVIRRYCAIQDRCFAIFCGVGNNGGDGFVVARKLHSNGGRVKVFLLGETAKFKGAAKRNLDIVSRLAIEVLPVKDVESLAPHVQDCHVFVDAILGTGLTRSVAGLYRRVVELINHSNKPVFCVDIPSGVQGDTGQVMGVAVKGDYTVTFGLPKLGNLLYPGCQLGGKLYVTHISFPPSIYTAERLKTEINQTPPLPARDVAGHKSDFGDVLFVAGAAGYYGAPYFSALSFMKAGGGYARLAAPASITPFIAGKGSEIVFAPQQETASGSISLANKADLLALAGRVDMLVLGPGLSLDNETQQLARELAGEIGKPLLVDGDGITALAADLQIIRRRAADTILTPHLGEMSRITGLPVAEIEQRKVDVARRCAVDLGAYVVLKGAHSLIAFPDERVFINMSGNSGMATAGSGDVLTGTIAAMSGLGLPLGDAVRKGVYMHGLAGDLAALEKGEDGITAQDIMEALPQAVRLDRQGLPEALAARYAGAEVIL